MKINTANIARSDNSMVTAMSVYPYKEREGENNKASNHCRQYCRQTMITIYVHETNHSPFVISPLYVQYTLVCDPYTVEYGRG